MRTMPYFHTWEQHGLLREFAGHVTSAEIARAVIESHEASAFDEYRYVINDFRAACSIKLDAEVMDEVAAMDRAAYLTNPRVRVAVVQGPQTVMDTVAAYSASHLSPYPLQVFQDMESARRWACAPLVTTAQSAGTHRDK